MCLSFEIWKRLPRVRPGHSQPGLSNVHDRGQQNVVTCKCDVISNTHRAKLASTWHIQMVDEDTHVRARIAVWCLKEVWTCVVW